MCVTFHRSLVVPALAQPGPRGQQEPRASTALLGLHNVLECGGQEAALAGDEERKQTNSQNKTKTKSGCRNKMVGPKREGRRVKSASEVGMVTGFLWGVAHFPHLGTNTYDPVRQSNDQGHWSHPSQC